jgi:hypothetical protein
MFVVLAVVAGCAGPAAGTIRFAAQPPILRVDDRQPLERKPSERPYYRSLYQLDGFFVRRLTRAMDLPSTGRALDVNSVDEVPDSTWFTNRIGVRDVPLDELRRGPNVDDSPLAHLPLTIIGAKVGGMSMGFVVEDALHDKFILKFDRPERPEMETGAHVIVQRIMWACGYNVPEDYLGYLRRDDLQLSPTASVKDELGNKARLLKDRVDKSLETVFKTQDGQYRVLVSRFIPGVPIGPYAREGTRPDDPNDRIAHERRRTIRGEVALFSWVNHTDIQEDNTLDSFVPEPGSKVRGHVVHYLIDFGKALGVMNTANQWKTAGYTYRWDAAVGLKTLLTLGLWDRPWDQIDAPALVGLGMFEAEQFDPAQWTPNSPYWPFDDADQFDGFWGAKIAMRFTRAQLAAAVDEARFSDPRTASYLVDTLVARQRKVGSYWFSRVSPLDHFTVEPAGTDAVKLCFDDLAVVYGLEPSTPAYETARYDRRGAALADRPLVGSTGGGHACIDRLPLAPGADRYTIVRLAVRRDARVLPAVRVHLAKTATGEIAVIGLRRD